MNQRAALIPTLVFPVLALFASAVALAPSEAFASCNPGRGSLAVDWLVGQAWQPGGSIGGAGANIDEYHPYVTHGPDAAFSMQDDPNGTGHWSQEGWWLNGVGTRKFFIQDWDNNIMYTQMWAPFGANIMYTQMWAPFGGSNNRYTVTYGGFGANVAGYHVNGSIWTTDRIDFIPNRGDFASEVHNVADQMPGGYTNPENFVNAQVWTGGGWTLITGYTFNDNATYYGGGEPYPGKVQTWDKKCPT